MVSGGGANSALDSNFNQLLTENSSYTWNLQSIDSPIEVSYKCFNEKGEEGQDFGVFSVKVAKEEINKVEVDLSKGKNTKVNISFGFSVDKGLESLKWLRENRGAAYMTVSNDWDGGLRIALKEVNMKAMRISDVNLRCKIKTENGMSELQEYKNSNEIFSGWVDLKKSEQTVSLRGWGGGAKLSLYQCSLKGKKEGTVSCDLKITDLSGWMWSARVSQKAKFQSVLGKQEK